MIDVGAFVELRDVENGLRRMQLAGVNLRPVFQASRKALREDQRDHAKSQRGPDGAWPALAQSTLEHRKARSGKQGRKRKRPIRARGVKTLGRLPGAFKITITSMSIRATARPLWSGVHNDPRGGQVGHGATVPGREYLWASSRLLGTVARKAVDYMTNEWRRI